jgi:hypothetical protein
MTEQQRAEARAKARDTVAERKRVHLQMVGTSLEELAQTAPPAYQEMVAKAKAKGGLRTLLKLKCLDCCCWQREEVRRCTCVACPLHPVRPYQ